MSLAALKRRCVVGTELEMLAGPPSFTGREIVFPWRRIISHVQTNAIVFRGDEFTRGRESWLWWPKASYVEVREDGFTVKDPDGNSRYDLVYRFV